MVTLPVKFPSAVGANCTVRATDAFGAKVALTAGAEVTENGAVGIVKPWNVTVWLPTFVRRVFWLAVVPATIAPKASDVGWAVRDGPWVEPVPDRPSVAPLPVAVVALSWAV